VFHNAAPDSFNAAIFVIVLCAPGCQKIAIILRNVMHLQVTAK